MPISGSVKMTAGIAAGSKAAGRPLSASAATTPSALALWASAGPATTSPIAAMRLVARRSVAHRDEAVGADRHAGGVEPEVVRVRHAADRDHHALSRDGVLAVGVAHHELPVLEPLGGAWPGAGRRRAPRSRRTTGAASDGSTVGSTRSSASTTRDLRAELGEGGPELEADVPGADDGHARGDLGEGQRSGRVEHALAVEGQVGQLDRPRAGGHDRLLELEEERLAARGANGGAVGSVEASAAVDYGHVAGGQQLPDRAGEAEAEALTPGLEALE